MVNSFPYLWLIEFINIYFPIYYIPPGKLTVCDIENGPDEIVSFPINSMVIVHRFLYVYLRVTIINQY